MVVHKSFLCSNTTFLYTLALGVLFMSGPPGWIVGGVCGFIALPALGESVRWDIYRDILVDLEDYIEDWEGVSGGGF